MNPKVAQEFEGILLIDKPQGCTSHDVVDRVRRKLKMKRIGHAGTLDPLATGLLIILVGRATKASQYLMSLDKVYEGEMTLGVETDSHDSDGKEVAVKPVEDYSHDALKAVMAEFMGDQFQVPPMFSAKKVDGRPLYKMARKGKTVEREPRFIHVSGFDLLSYEERVGTFRLACTKGTYVRTVVHDLGQKLGCGAHMSGLRRTASGSFSIEDAWTLAAFEEMSSSEIKEKLIDVCKAVPSLVA